MANVELVQVSGDKDINAAVKWAKKESFPWPTILRPDIAKTFLKDSTKSGYPTYFLYDKDGNELAKDHSSAPIMKKLAEVNK